MEISRVIIFGCVLTGAAACGGGADRYVYYPIPNPDASVMVKGCDGFSLGTVRVDTLTNRALVCTPNRIGCNDTRDEGCGEGSFASTRYCE